MSRPAVIVDTNVVVAGLLTKHEASPDARILDGMLGAAFPFVVSEALLAEYRTVLVRPNPRCVGASSATTKTSSRISGSAITGAGAGGDFIITPA